MRSSWIWGDLCPVTRAFHGKGGSERETLGGYRGWREDAATSHPMPGATSRGAPRTFREKVALLAP